MGMWFASIISCSRLIIQCSIEETALEFLEAERAVQIAIRVALFHEGGGVGWFGDWREEQMGHCGQQRSFEKMDGADLIRGSTVRDGPGHLGP